MPNTRAQLVNEALELFQQEGAGENVDALDYAAFDAAVPRILAELSEADVVTVGDVEAIDDAIFLPLARILMNEVGEKFGRPTDPAFRAESERRIRIVLADRPLYVHSQPDYF